MIHLATYRLPVTDQDGTPAELDIGTLEKRLADAFRKLGFSDVWMAEDVALTVEEKIRMNDATPLSRTDVDAIVVSVLNASGFQDVAREYASGCGDFLDDAQKDMKPWEGRLGDVLRHALPLTERQIGDVSKLAETVLRASGIAKATDRFIVALALHLLVNNSSSHVHFVEETADGAPKTPQKACTRWQDVPLSEAARGMMANGVLKPLPFSDIFPRARIALGMEALTSQCASGWISSIGLCAAFDAIAPCILEILKAMRMEISARHPLQADSPSHVILPQFMDYLEKEPNLWRKRDRDETRSLVERLIDEKIVAAADYPVVVSIR